MKLIVVLLYLAIIIGTAAGWILNIVDLIHMTGLSGMMVARVVGIFVFPLGAVLGYL